MAAKPEGNPSPEFDSLTDVALADNANVHGVIANVSPIKKGTGTSSYFEANLTDGEKKLRVVGFSTAHRKRLSSFEDTMTPVSVQNCRVKRAKHSNDLEIMLKSHTVLQSSPKKFSATKVAQIFSAEVSLGGLNASTYSGEAGRHSCRCHRRR